MSLASQSAERRLAATVRHLSGSQSAGASSGGTVSSGNTSKSSPTTSTTTETTIRNVTVFGAGLMGAGIAQVALTSGIKVTLCDVSRKALDGGLAIITKSLTRRAKSQLKGKPAEQDAYVKKVLEGLRVTTDSESAVVEADIVIEAIIENLAIKQFLFAKLDKAAKESCIFVTNTSSLPVGEIAEKLGEGRRKRFGGLHFFNRTPQMKLVEVIRTSETSDTVFDTLFEFGKQLGKVPVACKDTPGFIVNRLLVPYMREAFLMMERGDATAEDIDTAMKLGAGYPMGPLELTDLVGLDIGKAIADGWRARAERGDDRVPRECLRNSPLMEKLVAEGKLGVKSGEGIFKYSK